MESLSRPWELNAGATHILIILLGDAFLIVVYISHKHHLQCDKLVELWVAKGFLRSTNEGDEMEDVGSEYF